MSVRITRSVIQLSESDVRQFLDEIDRKKSKVNKYTPLAEAILGPLLVYNSRDDFQSEFNKPIQDAAKLLGPVQRTAVRAWVDNDLEQDLGKYRDYDAAMESMDKAVHVPSNPMEPLFPRVWRKPLEANNRAI